MNILKKVKEFIYWRFIYSPKPESEPEISDFDKNNPLGGGGERVDFIYTNNLDVSKLDMFQLNHYRRYEFAKDIVQVGEICGDFACGSGYGSAMLATKGSKVVGADLNGKVITEIKKRYSQTSNLTFLCENLLNLKYTNYFDTIVSFETIEHFEEVDILKLLAIYNKALKPNGKLIFSTPFMQERSEGAIKLGFHLTFYINEEKITSWLGKSGFKLDLFKYQNYQTHSIQNDLEAKDFILCVAHKTA